MIKLQDVSYVRLGTRDLEGATRFATDYLGLEVAERTKDSVYFRSDEREHTLCYFEGDPGDQVAGFEIAQRSDLEDAASTLERLGHEVCRSTPEEAE
jgi:2,3-dihydroxy-p-cumate/2,3-dihydroxybenzoate 3,4-dioxygenase